MTLEVDIKYCRLLDDDYFEICCICRLL